LKTAAGYVRVSTPGQAKDQKTSPENQEQEIHDYAKKHELKVVDVYRDLGVSGKTSERPALQQLLMNAKSGRFEVAVVHRLSRFGRNARDLLNNVSVLQEAGVQFRSIKEGIDFSSGH
jgi:site-specific DNA recombinase